MWTAHLDIDIHSQSQMTQTLSACVSVYPANCSVPVLEFCCAKNITPPKLEIESTRFDADCKSALLECYFHNCITV
jgi:hypothetical protein